VTRLIAVVGLATALAGCVTLAPPTPSAVTSPALAAGHANMPASAARNPNDCIENEGYGRGTDCDSER